MIQIPVILNNTLITDPSSAMLRLLASGLENADFATGNKDSGTKCRVVLKQLIHGNIVLALGCT